MVQLAGHTVGYGTFEPGWKWSENVKPIAGTDSCQVAHFGYVLSGSMRVYMDDGQETEINPGDVVAIPPGHDAEVPGSGGLRDGRLRRDRRLRQTLRPRRDYAARGRRRGAGPSRRRTPLR